MAQKYHQVMINTPMGPADVTVWADSKDDAKNIATGEDEAILISKEDLAGWVNAANEVEEALEPIEVVAPNWEIPTDLVVGKRYYIRTATYAAIGTVKKVTQHAFHLKNVKFVAESGNIDNMLKTGDPSSGEPLKNGLIVFWGGMIDAQRCK